MLDQSTCASKLCIGVPQGPEGKAAFKKQVNELFGLGLNSRYEVTFECKLQGKYIASVRNGAATSSFAPACRSTPRLGFSAWSRCARTPHLTCLLL